MLSTRIRSLKLTPFLIAATGLGFVACGPESQRGENSSAARSTEAGSADLVADSPVTQSVQQGRERVLISATGVDSVFLDPIGVYDHQVLWAIGTDEYWRSGDLYGGRPEVALADLNGDGRTDLFWSLGYEETNATAAVLSTNEGPELLLIPFDECIAGNLRREDGQYVIETFEGGAYPLIECGGAVPSICGEEAYWPRYFRVVGESLSEVAPPGRYRVRADVYRRKAAEMDSLFQKPQESPYPLEQICGTGFPAKLRAMADSADTVSRIGAGG